MDDATLGFLMLFKERGTLNPTQLGAILDVDVLSLADPIHYLMSLGYIEKGIVPHSLDDDSISFDTPLKITYKGKIAILQTQNNRKYFKHSEFRAWGTLFIAVVALFLSILSLCLQYL